MKNIKAIFLIFTCLLLGGCNIIQKDINSSIYSNHKNFARFEFPQNEDECSTDSECFIGGCNGETCTAYEPKITTCDVPEEMLSDLSCKCIGKKCIWTKK